jgi:DNA-binding SARP family transcriptional activator
MRLANHGTSAQTRLRVMRGFELTVGGSLVALPSNVERVIAFLTVRNRPQHRLTIASTLWMDTTEDRAAANLRTALWKARQSIGDGLVTKGSYVTVAPEIEVDLHQVVGQVQRLIDDSGVLLAEDSNPDDLGGDLLPEWDEDWILFERERFRQLRIHALEALCRRLSAAGRASEAIDAGLTAVAAEPLRESAQQVLILAHLDEGNVSEARRQYDQYRDLLWEALGVEPSQTLRTLVGSSSPANRFVGRRADATH